MAIFLVILNHVTESAYQLNLDFYDRVAWYTRACAWGFFTLGRLGVPIFFFLTGFFLLDRTYNTEQIKRFYQKNFAGLLLTTEIWIVFYNIFRSWYDAKPVDIDVFIRNVLFLKQVNMSHMWYMATILGIYLTLPIMANAINQINLKNLKWPLIAAFAYLFMPTVINVFRKAAGMETVSGTPNFAYFGGTYGFLIIVGYLVKKDVFRSIKTRCFVLLFVAGYLSALLLEFYSYDHSIAYNIWYDSAPLVISSFSLFMICLRRKRISCPKLLTTVGRLSFGLFLVHNIVRMILSRYIHASSHLITEFMLLIGTVTISFGIVYLLSRNKMMGEILFRAR